MITVYLSEGEMYPVYTEDKHPYKPEGNTLYKVQLTEEEYADWQAANKKWSDWQDLLEDKLKANK